MSGDMIAIIAAERDRLRLECEQLREYGMRRDAELSALQAEAGTRLAAAAPELLEALKRARDDLDHLAFNIVREDGEAMTQAGAGSFAEESYKRADAAIAKATGAA